MKVAQRLAFHSVTQSNRRSCSDNERSEVQSVIDQPKTKKPSLTQKKRQPQGRRTDDTLMMTRKIIKL